MSSEANSVLISSFVSLLQTLRIEFLTISFGSNNKLASSSLSCLILAMISACMVMAMDLGSLVQHRAFSTIVSVWSIEVLSLLVMSIVLRQIFAT